MQYNLQLLPKIHLMLKFFFFMLQQLELLLVMFCQVLPMLHCTSMASSPIRSTFHFSIILFHFSMAILCDP